AADGDRSGTIPPTLGEAAVFAGSARSLTIASADGRMRLAFSFAEPTGVLLQDDRQWSPTFSVRLGYSGGTRTFKAGEPFAVRFAVAAGEPLALVADEPLTL